MSVILKQLPYPNLSNLVMCNNGEYYWVRTSLSYHKGVLQGYVTLVYHWDQLLDQPEVTNQLYYKYDENDDEIEEQHHYICLHLEEYIK